MDSNLPPSLPPSPTHTRYMDCEEVSEVALLSGLLSEGVGAQGVLILLGSAHPEGSGQAVSAVTHDLIGGELCNAGQLGGEGRRRKQGLGQEC